MRCLRVTLDALLFIWVAHGRVHGGRPLRPGGFQDLTVDISGDKLLYSLHRRLLALPPTTSGSASAGRERGGVEGEGTRFVLLLALFHCRSLAPRGIGDTILLRRSRVWRGRLQVVIVEELAEEDEVGDIHHEA